MDERVAHDLSMRINQLDDRVGEIDKRLVEIEATRPLLVDIVNENKETNKELSKTMYELRVCIEGMNDKIDAQGEKIDGLDNRVGILDSKINAVDEKGKFDILGFVKAHWLAIGALLYIGIEELAKIF